MLKAIRRLISTVLDCPFGISPAWAFGQCLAF